MNKITLSKQQIKRIFDELLDECNAEQAAALAKSPGMLLKDLEEADPEQIHLIMKATLKYTALNFLRHLWVKENSKFNHVLTTTLKALKMIKG